MNDNKNRAIKLIMENIYKYMKTTNSFKINILPNEWEVFFEVLYEYAVLKQLEEEYFNILNIIIDNALFKHKYNNDHKFSIYLIRHDRYKRYTTNNYFTIDNLLDSLRTLHTFKFRNSEIEEICKEIRMLSLQGELVDIKTLIKK